MRIVDSLLVLAGLAPKEPEARGRPAEEIISEIEQREQKEIERIRKRTEVAIESRKYVTEHKKRNGER